MTHSSTAPPARHAAPDLPSWAVVPFLLMTFGIAWGILILWITRTEQMTALFGELGGSHPLFIIATYAPAISALCLVAILGGRSRLKGFLSRLLLWRAHWGWYALVAFGFSGAFYAGALIKGNLWAEIWPAMAAGPLLGLLALRLLTGPVEEIGWNGVLRPLLQRKLAPIWSGLILGFLWSLWHLPAFFLAGTPQSAWPFLPFFAGSTAAAVMVGAMFNASRGSLLLPILAHAQMNNPIFPDAQPYDSLFYVALAIVVVWWKRDTMFTCEGAATSVIGPS